MAMLGRDAALINSSKRCPDTLAPPGMLCHGIAFAPSTMSSLQNDVTHIYYYC